MPVAIEEFKADYDRLLASISTLNGDFPGLPETPIFTNHEEDARKILTPTNVGAAEWVFDLPATYTEAELRSAYDA
ncbi:hypothetical protein AGMMS49959_12240 [Planctomycetales bacterium]|nr:hypothetical protein AGMMS49959_12240 [Planctomycetales bacterium]